MLALKDAGCCVLLGVTHRIAELVRIADSVTVLRRWPSRSVGSRKEGRGGGKDITEENLLQLMSASSGHSARGEGEAQRLFLGQKPALQASELRLKPDAAAFDFKVLPRSDRWHRRPRRRRAGRFHSRASWHRPTPRCRLHSGDGPRVPEPGKSAIWRMRNRRVSPMSLGTANAKGSFPICRSLRILASHFTAGCRAYSAESTEKALTQLSPVEKGALEHTKFGAVGDKITTLSGGVINKRFLSRAPSR